VKSAGLEAQQSLEKIGDGVRKAAEAQAGRGKDETGMRLQKAGTVGGGGSHWPDSALTCNPGGAPNTHRLVRPSRASDFQHQLSQGAQHLHAITFSTPSRSASSVKHGWLVPLEAPFC
jgi:hypothetical protein